MFIGIDPGADGGLAVIGPEGIFAEILKDPRQIEEVLDSMGCEVSKVLATMERPQPVRLNSVASTHKAGWNCGKAEGYLAALKVPYQLVAPGTWRAKMLLGTDAKLDKKTRAIIACQRLFPQVSIMRSRGAKAHHGMAEALLMAEYGRRLRV